MKICKKTIIIFLVLIILLYSIIPPKRIYAVETSEAGKAIASVAEDWVNGHAAETKYHYLSVGVIETNPNSPQYNVSEYHRMQAYKGIKTTIDGKTRYWMDCVGFVSTVIHSATGLGSSEFTYFAGPIQSRADNGVYPQFKDYFRSYSKGTQPIRGDILIYYDHVAIYLGDIDGDGLFEIAHSSNKGYDGAITIDDQNTYGRINNYSYMVRITEAGANNIEELNYSFDGQGTGGVITPSVDDSEAFDQYINSDYKEQVDVNGRNNSSSFYYNGTPKKGEYLGKVKGNWLFNTLEDAADWLLGILTMGIKAQLVGWASIFEGWANNVVEGVTTEGYEFKFFAERVTVEDVIYNKIPILDVNLFNFEKAGGQDLKQDSSDLVYNLRMKIAQWYVAIRTICIILLLFTLIYLGIRTAIASVAKEKSEYKQKLVSWVVSFLIVMFIHYFMILILNFNEIAISWITPPGGAEASASIYEQMRSNAYEIPATKGWTGAIVYVFLVYYLIKMLFFYFKRVLIVYILAILSPAMGIAYSIQRINGKSKALGVWVKEFSFNVIIQFVHALIYTIMMNFILAMIPNITATSAIPFSVLLFVLLNFILDVEDIIKNIFQIKANSLKSIVKTMFSLKNRFLPAVLIGGAVYKAGKSAVVNAYDKSLTNSLNLKYDQYKVDGNDEVSQAINKEIERLKQQEKDHTMQLNKASIDFAKSKFKGAVTLVTTVPAVFEEPIAGAATFAYTVGALSEGFDGSGAYEAKAEVLEKSTDGTNYIYIDDPNEAVNAQEKATTQNQTIITGKITRQNGNIIGPDGTILGPDTPATWKKFPQYFRSDGTIIEQTVAEETQQKTIRTYNTAKNKTYKFPKAVLRTGISLATVGTSRTVEETVKTAIKEHKTLKNVYSTRIEKLSVIGNLALKEVKSINEEVDRIKNRKLRSNIL